MQILPHFLYWLDDFVGSFVISFIHDSSSRLVAIWDKDFIPAMPFVPCWGLTYLPHE